ncbi:MAG: hypothetical protein M3Y87_33285, partial [Myxococcota bacterium]|nr:hypothetical protein [Myxococcota bacterium]
MRSLRSLVALVLAVLALSSCAPREDDDYAFLQSRLTAAERRVRMTQIRDAAAANGLTNAVLLAGIAHAETGLAHCWSEATWACMGPNSSDCGGGPVIAGAGDGPCSIMQGGLGMFQFDAGTFDQTLAREGDRILLIAGNVQAAIDFTVAMVIRSTYIDGVDNREQALAWMNGVVVGGARHMEWIQTVTHYYNGCVPGSCGVYDTRFTHYDDALRLVWDEMGADFWSMGMAPACDPVPVAGRVIDDTDPCVFLGGDLRFWRTASDAGYGGSLRWTRTTDAATASNYAIWRITVDAAGEYDLIVHTDPAYAQSRQARYVVTTDLGDETVPVDQTAAATRSLGTFVLATATEYAVRVDDHTGEPGSLEIQLVADALEVRAVAPMTTDAGVLPTDDASVLPTDDAGTLADASPGGDAGP